MSYRLVSLKERVLSRLRRLRKDDGGAAAVTMAILSPVLIGSMGIGAEAGYWYFTQRKLQHAADVAAHAAGVRKRVGDSKPGLQKAALETAAASGFIPVEVYSPNKKTLNLTVNNPPLSGSQVGKSEAVEVLLSETKPRLLSSVFSKEPVQIQARAVAKLTGGTSACVLALSDTASKAVEVSGNSSVTLNGCSVAANSVQDDAYYMPNSTAKLTADCISTVGGSVIKDTDKDILDLKTCSSVRENSPKALDPYADVPEPTVPNKCEAELKVDGGIVQNPTGVRCLNGLKLSRNVLIASGLYIINGGEFEISAQSKVVGKNITFFFANNATAKFAANAPLVDLAAPTPEVEIEVLKPYIGILFFSARCTPGSTDCDEVFKITGSSGSRIQGAMYLPGSVVEFTGNSTSSSNCLQIIADQVTFTGDSKITMGSACEAVGTKQVVIDQIVKLVE